MGRKRKNRASDRSSDRSSSSERTTKKTSRPSSAKSTTSLDPVTEDKTATKGAVVKGSKAKADVPMMPYHDEFHIYRLLMLKNLMGIPEMNDVTLIVGSKKKEINTNRFPLMSVSKEICELFDPIEYPFGKTVPPITMPDGISVKGMNAIIRFAYGYDPEVTLNNVVDVTNAAKVFKMEPLEKKCMRYIKDQLTMSDAYLMKYLESAIAFQNQDIVKICFTSLQLRGGIAQFLASPTFCSLSAELVNVILKQDSLPVEEPIVWETCLKWAEFQAKKNGTDQKKELKKVYHHVRLPLVDAAYFSTKVVPIGILAQEEMLRLYGYLCNKMGNSPTDPFLKAPRILWEETEICRFSKPPNGEWFHLADYVDGICFTVDRACELMAVGTYVGEGSTKAVAKVFKGCGEDREQLARKQQTIKAAEKLSAPHKLELPTPIKLAANQIYELELDTTGPVSFKGNQGRSELVHSQNGLDITFTYSKYRSGASESTIKKGDVPSMWIRVLSG